MFQAKAETASEPVTWHWQVCDGQAQVYVGHMRLIYSSSLHKNRWREYQLFLYPIMQDFLLPEHLFVEAHTRPPPGSTWHMKQVEQHTLLLKAADKLNSKRYKN